MQRVFMAPNTAFEYEDVEPRGDIRPSKALQDMDIAVTSSSGSFSPSSPGTYSSTPGSPFSSTVSSSSSLTLSRRSKSQRRQQKLASMIRQVLQSMFPLCMMSPCRMLGVSSGHDSGLVLGSRVSGTIFGHRRGHVHFAVQDDQRSIPTLILEFSTLTSNLVADMASGLVRIALECEKLPGRSKLYQEPLWSIFCNGRKTGYAIRRDFSEFDRHVLTTVQAVSMGAGVLPVEQECAEGELMYMRARFERVIGSRDSEAFYMMNPDATGGGPELSIFLLRI